MEHPCAKCGAMVKDGVPFCRHCGAPQIRVVVEPSPEGAAGGGGSGTTSREFGAGPGAVISKSGIQWNRALPMAALGGVLSVVLLGVPLGAYGLAFLAGGAVAVFLYERRSAGVPLRQAMGARIGAASGGFGFLFLAITLIATSVYRADELRKLLAEKVGELAARGYSPEQVQAAQSVVKTPEGLAFFVITSLVVMALIFVAGSAIGGALTARFLSRRRLL